MRSGIDAPMHSRAVVQIDHLDLMRRKYICDVRYAMPAAMESNTLQRVGTVEHLSEHIDHVVTLWHIAQADWTAATLTRLHQALHALAGVAGISGFLSISDAAHLLDQDLRRLTTSSSIPSPDQLALIHAHIECIRQQAIEFDHREFADQPLLAATEPASRMSPDPLRVVLAAHDPLLVHSLPPYLQTFGYLVEIVTEYADLPGIIASRRPDLLLLERTLPNGEPVDPATLGILPTDARPPLLILSADDHLAARLHTIRLGGVGFCRFPIDYAALIDTVDQIIGQRNALPYRILLVEDGVVMASYYARLLRQAGMIPRVVTNPLDVVGPLMEWQPDVIVLDMYMPGCTGLELAAILRQQPAYAGTPIVFLSSETALDMQLAALQLGGDDFLTKPIQPEHLIAVLRARAQRGRSVRALMVRDSLTGLFNHTTFSEHLEVEVARARRHQSALSLVMIDIDHFKQVNDTYGHPAGDRVLKRLARLLQQRLRRSDIIGRYGGEEFAVILPGADGAAAQRVVDDLRRHFASVPQVVEQEEFSVTFSAGIAVFPLSTTTDTLTNMADKALYLAKRSGRNRVVLASGVADGVADSVAVTP
jgi:diguanylate cyclase (GGDEF)-like protein